MTLTSKEREKKQELPSRIYRRRQTLGLMINRTDSVKRETFSETRKEKQIYRKEEERCEVFFLLSNLMPGGGRKKKQERKTTTKAGTAVGKLSRYRGPSSLMIHRRHSQILHPGVNATLSSLFISKNLFCCLGVKAAWLGEKEEEEEYAWRPPKMLLLSVLPKSHFQMQISTETHFRADLSTDRLGSSLVDGRKIYLTPLDNNISFFFPSETMIARPKR